jgi:eukaryotic-like serine/threonine-protein kinase
LSALMENLRVCRACGHTDSVDSRGGCPACGGFFDLAIVSRAEAEQIARERRRRLLRRRLVRYGVALAFVAGATGWTLAVYFDVGIDPPSATTSISASVAPDTWPQVRRTPENTGFISDLAPFPHRVRWTYRTSGSLLASPAVAESHVYLTTGDGRTVALDRQAGHVVWEYPGGGPSSSTPAVAGEIVISAIRPGRVVALNRRTGARIWEADLRHSILASPIVMHGTVYIGTADKKLFALDAANGRERWAFTTAAWVVDAVAYATDRVIVPSQYSRVHVVSMQTGRERLVYDTGSGRFIGAGVALQGNRAYFGTARGRVWAIDWQATTYPLERTLMFWKLHLYVWGFVSQPPVQKATVWSRRVGGDVVHTPAIAHDTVYFTTSQGKVLALETGTGSERWSADLKGDITAAPTVAGTTVLIGTRRGIVFGLEANTGKVLWEFKAASEITGSPIVVRDTMYVVSSDGALYAVIGAR